MESILNKNIFFIVFLLFSFQQVKASQLECGAVFSHSVNIHSVNIHSSPEERIIQNTLVNLKTFNSRLAQELKTKSSKLPAVVMIDFLKREFDPVDEIYRNIIINDLEVILTEYNKSESQIYDVITKLQENLKPSVFKKIFSTTSKMAQTKDSLVDEIINCRLGLRACAATIGEKTPEFERTYTLVKNLFFVYKSITEHLASNHQQIIDILSQSEESKSNAIMLFEGKMNSLESQLSVIKIKKDQLEQQYVNAVNVVSLKYPEINNQIKLLISLGAPEKIESGFHAAIENQRNENEKKRILIVEYNLKLEQDKIAAAERLKQEMIKNEILKQEQIATAERLKQEELVKAERKKQEELAKADRLNNNIAFINDNQKLNMMQTNLEPNDYKIDFEIIEEQIIKANHFTTRDLIYFLSLAQAIKSTVGKDNDYYKNNFYKFFYNGRGPLVPSGHIPLYQRLFADYYNVSMTNLNGNWVYYFERNLPILLDKWKPDFIRQELELKNELNRMITEMRNIITQVSTGNTIFSTLTNAIFAKKIKELTEKVNGVKYEN